MKYFHGIAKKTLIWCCLEKVESVNRRGLGKSGIGKSTWVNSFFNFLMLENFESALIEEKVYAPIYTKFKHADMNITTDSPEERLVEIEVGEPENVLPEYELGSRVRTGKSGCFFNYDAHFTYSRTQRC